MRALCFTTYHFASLPALSRIKICALLGYYAASCDNCLPTFRDRYVVRKRRKTITTRRRVISQKSADLINRGGSLKSRIKLTVEISRSSCSVRCFCPILAKTGSTQILVKLPNAKFHENPFNRFPVFSYLETDGEILTDAHRDADVHKNVSYRYNWSPYKLSGA
jgi:hypothetical protein